MSLELHQVVRRCTALAARLATSRAVDDEVVLGERALTEVFDELCAGVAARHGVWWPRAAAPVEATPDELARLYEQALELHCLVEDGDVAFVAAPGHRRRTTGTYYTPPVLVRRMVDRVLVADALSRVCDPSCGAGRFLVAAGRRMVGRHTRRHVFTECLYGMDIDPVAVSLCRLALLVEGSVADAEGGRAVFDHVRLGNALIGAERRVWEAVPDAAFAALPGDDGAEARRRRSTNRRERARSPTAPPFDAASADAWCAAFFWPTGLDAPPTHARWSRSEVDPTRVPAVVGPHRPVHWELAFPEVFARGGFDVVVGNPPWDQLESRPAEFFAARAPQVASARGNRERLRRLDDVLASRPDWRRSWERAVRHRQEQIHFLHTCGRYPNASRGRLNLATLFVDLGRRILRPGGQCALVVPTTLATGSFTRHFFTELMETGELRAFHTLDNRNRLFPDVKTSWRFGLLHLRAGGEEGPADFVFHAGAVADLDESERHILVTTDDLRRVNPETGTCPAFRHRDDARRVLAIHRRMPTLAEGWDFRATLMFMADEASHHLLPAPGVDSLPWLTASLVKPWSLPAPGDAWVPRAEVDRRLGDWRRDWMVVWQDVTDTNTMGRTLKAAIVPRAGCADGLPVLLLDRSPRHLAALVAILDSFVLDHVVRQKLGGVHLRFHVMRQLPVPSPAQLARPLSFAPAGLGEWLADRAVALASVIPAFAADAGWRGPPLADPEARFALRCELDAGLFHAYGLARADVAAVLEGFDVVARAERRRFGRPRSAEGILACFDRLEAAR